MAEIKSTLDIIMEKTRNLTLSAEEKRAFHEEEIRKKMLGLVQRFLDGHLQMKQIGEELNGLKEKDRVAAAKCVREECAKRLDPEGNNDPVLLLLRQAGGVDAGPVERLMTERRRELEKEKADMVFMPPAEEMYPQGFGAWVDVAKVTEVLEGAVRPGHFKGVATVVVKLFNIVEPTRAYFGQKDAQQVVVIKSHAEIFNEPAVEAARQFVFTPAGSLVMLAATSSAG